MKPKMLPPYKTDEPIVIVGAGPTGIGAAYALSRIGYDNWLILEKESAPGGLARSITDEKGFIWDIGGHVAFSHYDIYDRILDEAMDDPQWRTLRRICRIFCQDAWLPYPFQNNIHRLPKALAWECLEGLLNLSFDAKRKKTGNFEEFIFNTFGEGIARLFMLPYNRKVWACEPAKMSVQWLGERVATPEVKRIVQNMVYRKDDTDWGPNNTFQFPSNGGTGAIWSKLFSLLPERKKRLGAMVKWIDSANKVIELADGEKISYGHLINTMPLDVLATKLDDGDSLSAASKLTRASSHIIGVGYAGKKAEMLKDTCWMYFADKEIPFYRVTNFSLYSKKNVPNPETQNSLLIEVSESKEKSVDSNDIIQSVLDGLYACGLLERNASVESVFYHREEHGYPVPTLERDDALSKLLPCLEEKSILSRGRFGAWKYEVSNMDHSFMQGYESAMHIVLGVPELTLWHPNLINQRANPPIWR